MRKEKYIAERERGGGLYYEVSVKITENGKRRNITKTVNIANYPTKAAALRQAIIFRDQILNDIQNKQLVSRSDRTFAQVYEEMKVLFPKRIGTFRKYDKLNKKYMQALANIKIQNIDSVKLMMILNSMISTCSQKTMSEVFTIIKLVCKTARIKRYILTNPTDEIIVPKSAYTVKSLKKTTDIETVYKITDALAKTRGKEERVRIKHQMIIGAIWVMYYCGLRPAEAFALKKEDVDLTNMLLKVDKQIGTSLTEENVIRSAKTELSNRFVPIPDQLLSILKQYVAEDLSPFLFHDKKGNHLKLRYVQNTVYHTCKKLNINFNLYQLRHQFSTDLITNHADVRTVMELMGHTNPSMTVGYARSNDDIKKKALESRKTD